MNENVALDRLIATWMTDEVRGRAPERLLEDTLAVTSRTRPEPRWLALLKEPSMRAQSRVAVGIPSRRLVLAAVLVALLGLVLVAALIGSQLLKPPPAVADDWPMFRGDPTRSGIATLGPVGRPTIKWTASLSGAANAAVDIVGDTVYTATDDGIVHALALQDGRERWSKALPKGPVAGPIVLDRTVFVSDGNGRLFALDAADGSERWRTASTLTTPLNLGAGGGMLFVGSGKGGVLAAIDAKTGADRWRVTLPTSGGLSAPAFDGKNVYAPAPGGGFFALDAGTGAVRWRVDTGADPLGTAVVANGLAYVGAPADARGGHLRAVDTASGSVRWTAEGQISSPTVAGGRLFTDSNGSVAAWDEGTGTVLWQAAVRGGTRAPVVSGDVVYVLVDGEHVVYAFDRSTGGILWRFPVDSSNNCCIAVAKGLLFVGTERGTIYAIGGDGSKVSPAPIVAASSPFPGASHQGPVSASAAADSAAPSPTVSASASPSETAAAPLARFVSRFADPPDGLMPNRLVFDPSGHLWAADPYRDRFAEFTREGSFVGYWGTSGSRDGEFNLRRNNGDGYGSIAFGPDGSIYVLDVGNRHVQKFDAHRRFLRSWGGFGDTPGKYSDPVGIEVVADGTVYVMDDVRGVIERYDPNGRVLGSIEAFSNIGGGKFNGANAFTVDRAGNVYVSQIEPNQVAEFDRAGKLLRTFGAEGPFTFSDQPGWIAVDARGHVLVDQPTSPGSGPGIAAFGPDGAYLGGFGIPDDRNGDVRWPSGLALDGRGNLYVGDAGQGPESGEHGWIQEFRLLPPLVP